MLVHTTNGTPISVTHAMATVLAAPVSGDNASGHGDGFLLRTSKGMYLPAGEVQDWLEIGVGDRLACFFAELGHQQIEPVPKNEATPHSMAANADVFDNVEGHAGDLVAVFNLTRGKHAMLSGGIGEHLAGADLARAGLGFGLLVAGCAGLSSAVPSLGIQVPWEMALLAPAVAGTLGYLLRSAFRVDKEHLIEQAITDEAAVLQTAYSQAREMLLSRSKAQRAKARGAAARRSPTEFVASAF